MKVSYYPGCSLEGTAKEYDESTRAVCRALGIELEELEDWMLTNTGQKEMPTKYPSLLGFFFGER